MGNGDDIDDGCWSSLSFTFFPCFNLQPCFNLVPIVSKVAAHTAWIYSAYKTILLPVSHHRFVTHNCYNYCPQILPLSSSPEYHVTPVSCDNVPTSDLPYPWTVLTNLDFLTTSLRSQDLSLEFVD